MRRGHEKLPVYAAGKEQSVQEWQNLVRGLLDAGLLERDVQFGSLRLTAKAFEVLEGKEMFLLSQEPGPTTDAPEALAPPDAGLLRKLKALRKRLADDAHMPAFCIFSDRSLVDMAQKLPQSREQFLAVHGVGELKLANYGQQFLEIIRDHCAGCDELPPSGPEIKRLPGTHAEQIAKLFDEGQTIKQIAAAYQVQPETVVKHLLRFQQSGGTLDPGRVLGESKLEPSKQARVFDVFQQLGPERLAPVYQALGATVPYEALHLLRLYWFCKAQAR
jgi:ATP-dependent DNA helicase RecQ